MAFAGVRLNPFGVIIVVCFGLFSFLYIFGLPVLYRNDKVSMRELLSVSVDLAQRGGQRVKQIADNHKLNAKSKGMTNEGQQEMLTSGDIESHRTIVSGFQKAFPGLMVNKFIRSCFCSAFKIVINFFFQKKCGFKRLRINAH